MATIFSKIIHREIPAHIVAENEDALAFLDIRPLTKGHTLVIPKKEVDYLFDLEDEIYTRLHLFAKEVAIKIKKVIPCERISVAVIGLEVPHAHIHLIPINSMSDANFGNPKLKLSDEELKKIAEKIRSAS
ncbi:HIT family protein [Catalinimonas niigatensis]|uniref:HIT family protein n=1 Tax=Catalinimonas niigatensis TaxID=1397264 RepID=UPI00266557A9|nr:HIT family protein [Catalinimonas niigatensis]WPP49448.1 HIT family protein [Catalinimonas niigatensis]